MSFRPGHRAQHCRVQPTSAISAKTVNMKPTIFLVLVLFCILAFANAQQQYDADAWKSAAAYLKQAMNKKAKPCENFYEHVCGQYGADNETNYETTMGKANAVTQILIKAIKGVDLENAKTPEYQKVVKRFYDQCTSMEFDPYWPTRLYEAIAKRIGELPLFEKSKNSKNSENSSSIESQGLRRGARRGVRRGKGRGKILFPFENAAFKKNSQFEPWHLMGRLQRRTGKYLMVYTSVGTFGIGCQKQAQLYLWPLGPSTSTQAINATEVRTKVYRLALNLGLNTTELEPLVEPWLEAMIAFHDDWRLNVSQESSLGELISLSNMSTVIPNFDWQEYLRGLLPENVLRVFESDLSNSIYVSDVKRLDQIGQILKRHSEEAIRSMAFLKIFIPTEMQYFESSDEEYKELLVEFKPPSERCVEYAIRHLAPAVARLYFDGIGVDIMKWRHEIQMLGRNIFSAFRFLLNSVDWLDSEDKEKIQEKIDKITFKPGIPSWIGNETKVMQRITAYNTSLGSFENGFSAYENEFDRDANRLTSLGDNNDEDDDPDPSFEVNAYYDRSANRIDMLLGLMLPPLFNITYPLPVKYGGLGMVIGHELMHAFDADGIYASAYKEHKWLKPEAFREFGKKKACLVRQYSKYCYKDKGMCIKGDVTIGENIADIDGAKVAYTAYKIVTQVLGQDPPIPDMIDYTDDQIFFLSFARTWCSKETPTWLSFMLHDSHSPDKPRVEVAIRNLPLFAKAFQCTVGSKYAPMRRCSLWGDLEEPAKK